MGQPGGPQFSPDGKWFWDGAAWRPAVSADGRWRWNGYAWVGTGFRLGGLSPIWIVLIAMALVVLLAGTVFIATLFTISSYRGEGPVGLVSPRPSASQGPFTTIPCDHLEHTQVHYHAFLRVLLRGGDVPLPTDVGRKLGCYYWLHMHTNEEGVIHVESPADRTFTLGDFFDVWSDWSGVRQQLDATHVAAVTVKTGEKLAVFVDLDDGSGAKPYTGDPRGIVLRQHEIITLEITPPTVNPPPAFTWPAGF